MMYVDDDALLQMAIERSLHGDEAMNSNNDQNPSVDQMTLYEALGHSARPQRTVDNEFSTDYDLQRYAPFLAHKKSLKI